MDPKPMYDEDDEPIGGDPIDDEFLEDLEESEDVDWEDEALKELGL